MTILIPIPNRDFDPSEVAVSWRILKDSGCEVVFATPDAGRAEADPMMLTGEGLDIWGWMPGLRRVVLVGRFMRADRDARDAYAQLAADSAFGAPLTYADLDLDGFDGLLLPGGHRARGMRAYLESRPLQRFVAAFFDSGKPVGAICHGVLLAARSIDPSTGKSVLYGRRTTALTWPLERLAWDVGRIVRFWEPSYYRTYSEGPGDPPGYWSVQAEVTRALARPDDFLDVPVDAPDYALKTNGRTRDTFDDARPAWVVRDGAYVSARWPGDVHTFAKTFAEIVAERATTE
jgi:putative intracellular protease/amidase